MTSEQFVRLLDLRLTEVWDQEAFEEFFYTTGIGDIPEFNGSISYLQAFPGWHKKIEHKEYAGGLQAERKFIDDKKYAVLDNRAQMLARAAYRTREKLAARAFTLATSTAFDFMTSEEGVSLCNSGHLTKTGASTASGFDNTATTALSKTSLAAARLKARLFKTDIGERYEGWNNIGLIVPDNLVDTASEIVGSKMDPDSANNKINPQYGRYQVIPYMRLDDTESSRKARTPLTSLRGFCSRLPTSAAPTAGRIGAGYLKVQ
jgi:hypothetical protein